MDSPVRRVQLEDGELSLFSEVFARSVADALLRALLSGIAWRQDEITIVGKKVLIPRMQAWYADPGLTYTYSGLRLEPTTWSGPVAIIRDKVEALTGIRLNSVLLNWYRDGRDSNGWHSDDEPELGKNPIIASLSLGDTRKFALKHKRHPEMKHGLELKHNTLLLMSGAMQHHWRHCLPKTTKPVGDRINLTFRQIKPPPVG